MAIPRGRSRSCASHQSASCCENLQRCMMFPDRLIRTAIEHSGMETGLLKPFKGPQFSAGAQVIANSLLAECQGCRDLRAMGGASVSWTKPYRSLLLVTTDWEPDGLNEFAR